MPMKMKKYLAPSMREAIEAMRSELGEEAIILSTRTMPKPGTKPGAGEKVVELMAAIDHVLTEQDIPPEKRPIITERSAILSAGNAVKVRQYAQEFSKELSKELAKRNIPEHTLLNTHNDVSSMQTTTSEMSVPLLSEEDFPMDFVSGSGNSVARVHHPHNEHSSLSNEPVQTKTSEHRIANSTMMPVAVSTGSDHNALHSEIRNLKTMLESVANDVRYKHSASLNDICRVIFERLTDIEVRENVALQAIGTVMAQNNATNMRQAVLAIRKFLCEKMPVSSPIIKKEHRQVFGFVGPTGVGKTTTVAKLATSSKLLYDADVLLISADTYRVGGAEQLQRIGAIANIPCEVVYSAQELRQLMKREAQREMIFIDTVGRSPSSTAQIQEIRGYMEAAEPDNTFLLLNSSLSESSLVHVVKRFGVIKPTHLILTKLDEMLAPGPLLSALYQIALPLGYFTTGQVIPDDIERGSAERLAEMVLPDSFIEDYEQKHHEAEPHTEVTHTSLGGTR